MQPGVFSKHLPCKRVSQFPVPRHTHSKQRPQFNLAGAMLNPPPNPICREAMASHHWMLSIPVYPHGQGLHRQQAAHCIQPSPNPFSVHPASPYAAETPFSISLFTFESWVFDLLGSNNFPAIKQA